jgi:hypothetical protein
MEFKKTDRYYVELIAGPVIGLTIGVVNHFYPILKGAEKAAEIVSKVTDISFIIFGFLLTILALIMQSGSGIKKSPTYGRLVKANSLMVVLSLLLGFISLLMVFNFQDGNLDYPHDSLLSSFFFGVLVYLIVETAIYLMVFYKLVLSQRL